MRMYYLQRGDANICYIVYNDLQRSFATDKIDRYMIWIIYHSLQVRVSVIFIYFYQSLILWSESFVQYSLNCMMKLKVICRKKVILSIIHSKAFSSLCYICINCYIIFIIDILYIFVRCCYPCYICIYYWSITFIIDILYIFLDVVILVTYDLWLEHYIYHRYSFFTFFGCSYPCYICINCINVIFIKANNLPIFSWIMYRDL